MRSRWLPFFFDPQILEEHLTVEATVDASHADAATRLAALNDSSWHFLEATIGAFDKDYEVFSQRAWSVCAHDLILPSMCASRAYPRRVLGRVGRTTLSPTLTR